MNRTKRLTRLLLVGGLLFVLFMLAVIRIHEAWSDRGIPPIEAIAEGRRCTHSGQKSSSIGDLVRVPDQRDPSCVRHPSFLFKMYSEGDKVLVIVRAENGYANYLGGWWWVYASAPWVIVMLVPLAGLLLILHGIKSRSSK